MPRPKRGEKVRLNLDLPPPIRQRLEELVTETNAESMAEVVRRALALFDHFVSAGQGARIVYEDGREERLVLY